MRCFRSCVAIIFFMLVSGCTQLNSPPVDTGGKQDITPIHDTSQDMAKDTVKNTSDTQSEVPGDIKIQDVKDVRGVHDARDVRDALDFHDSDIIRDTGAVDDGIVVNDSGNDVMPLDTGIDRTVPECSSNDDCKGKVSDLGPCEKAVCIKGQCQRELLAAGSSCDDGNPCTVGDTCDQDGICQPGTPKDCDDNNLCTTDLCDKSTGQCTHEKLGHETTCDDGNSCTANDYCEDGVCHPGQNTCQCQTKADCESFEDGNLCNGTLICNEEHKCVVDPSTVVTCDHTNDTTCKANRCDPSTGKCGMTPINVGKTCNDNDPCTLNDTCNPAGQCKGTPNTCNDHNACTIDSCDPDSGDCNHKNKNCDDNDACTIDSCDPATGCNHTDANCDDHNACTKDSCDPKFGCMHQAISCDDNNPCTSDSCDPAKGCTHSDVNCDDGNVCTKDSCDQDTGKCIHENLGPNTPCDDGNSCTENDYCKDGVCQPGTSTCQCQTNDDCKPYEDDNLCNGTLVCNAQHQCVVDPSTVVTCDPTNNTTCMANKCDPSTGKCKMTPVNVDNSCNDNNPCTLNDTCDPNGNCKGTPKNCDDHNACTKDTCDGTTGDCIHTDIVCDDHNVCTIDSCDPTKGCTYTSVNCDDNNVCTDDYCLPANQACNEINPKDNTRSGYHCCHNPKAGRTCNDNNPCTTGDVCTSTGKCQGTPRSCDDGISCTRDYCESGGQQCGQQSAAPDTRGDSWSCCHDPDSSACNDNNKCTNDYCDASSGCKHTPVSCSDNDPCTHDSCDTSKGCTHTEVNCDDGDPNTVDYCVPYGQKCLHQSNPYDYTPTPGHRAPPYTCCHDDQM